MTWKQLTERDRREWKLSAINPHNRDTWRSGMRSAMCAASQLPGRGPTVVDMAPILEIVLFSELSVTKTCCSIILSFRSYSRTSVAQTLMIWLPRLFWTRFSALGKGSVDADIIYLG